MMRALTTLFAATFALLLALPAVANPIACELEGGFSSDGAEVSAWFLGQCGTAADYESQQILQHLIEGEWVTVDGDWVEDGVESAEGGSGEMDYNVFRQTSLCDGSGEQQYRIAYLYDDSVNGWSDGTVLCDGGDDDDAVAADDDDAATDDDDAATDDDDDGVSRGLNCSSAGSSSPALMVGLLAGLAIFMRRRS